MFVLQWMLQLIAVAIMAAGGALFAFASLSIGKMLMVTVLFCFAWGSLSSRNKKYIKKKK